MVANNTLRSVWLDIGDGHEIALRGYLMCWTGVVTHDTCRRDIQTFPLDRRLVGDLTVLELLAAVQEKLRERQCQASHPAPAPTAAP